MTVKNSSIVKSMSVQQKVTVGIVVLDDYDLFFKAEGGSVGVHFAASQSC